MDDLRWLRHALRLAEGSVDAGDFPFGAVLVSDDRVLLEGRETVATERERLGHAELNVLVEAGKRWPLTELSTFTLYSSTEPCPMCTGAVAWSVNRLVYGISQARMYELFPVEGESPRFARAWDCRRLLDHLAPPMEVLGPLLEEEAAVAHRKWMARWHGGSSIST